MGQITGMLLKYLGALLNRAAKGSITLTDRLTVLLVPFSTLVLWVSGVEMTNSLQETLLLGVAMTVIAVVILRLGAASYFLWKDDQADNLALRQALDAPVRLVETEMRGFTTTLRKELSNALGALAATATQPESVLSRDLVKSEDVWGLVRDVDRIINQLSYDTATRIAAIQFRNACVAIMAKQKTEGRWFYRQRQITFRILHKDDIVNDLLSLMELEIELEKRGESTLAESISANETVFEELKSLMSELGDRYYDPVVREKLKRAVQKS